MTWHYNFFNQILMNVQIAPLIIVQQNTTKSVVIQRVLTDVIV